MARQGVDTLSFWILAHRHGEKLTTRRRKSSWPAVGKSKERKRLNLEPEGEAREADSRVYYDRAEGGPADLEGEGDHKTFSSKSCEEQMWRSRKKLGMDVDGDGVSQEENVETQSPKKESHSWSNPRRDAG